MLSRTSEDPAEGNHQCPPSIYAQWARQFKYVRTFSAVQYCTCALIKRATYALHRRHVSKYDICVERCSTMRFLAGTAQYFLNCILRASLVPRPSILKEDGLVPIATMLVRMRWPLPEKHVIVYLPCKPFRKSFSAKQWQTIFGSHWDISNLAELVYKI